MIIGIPREIKDQEYRVAMTPGGVETLVHDGHKVLLERNAGMGSGFVDAEYVEAGALIIEKAKELFDQAEMIIKVKEPLPSEYALLKEGQILFTYLHLAACEELTYALLDRKVIGIGYETVQLANGSLPLLTPMSEIAGRMAVQIGAHYLQKNNGGRGILLSGVPGVRPASVVIVGGGVVGTNAAQIALGMGARVTIIDINIDRLRYLDHVLAGSRMTIASNRRNIMEATRRAEILIGAVLVPGDRAPILVDQDMISQMTPGSVVIDVAVDQGGCIETIHPTSHSDPTYTVDGVLHYAVPNIPGAVPRTATMALANATLPYARAIANKGYKVAIQTDTALRKGINVIGGELVHPAVGHAFGLEIKEIEQLL